MNEQRKEQALPDSADTLSPTNAAEEQKRWRPAPVRNEVWLWLLLMVLACLPTVWRAGGMLFNDSYQYLSMAENLQARGEIATSIIEFDTERSRGRIPAPATTVAPGYPVAIRTVEWVGVSPERAGLLVSLVSMLAVLPLLWWGTGLLGASRNVQRAVALCWASNAGVIVYATSVISEGLFILLSVGGVVLLLYSEKAGESAWKLAVPGGMALIGLSYCVRYAGVLLVAPLCLYVAWRVLFRRERVVLWISSLAVCLGIVACGMIRNAMIAGTWRGGNDLVVHTPLSKVLHDSASIGYHLFFGLSRPHLGIGLVIVVMAALSIGILLRGNVGKIGARLWCDPAVLLLLIVVGGYVAGMIYAGMTTMIIYNFSPRYFLPILPELLLLGAAGAAAARHVQTNSRMRHTVGVLAMIALGGYAIENVRDLHRYDYHPEHVRLAGYYQEPTPESRPLGEWVERNIPPDSVVLATDGQASAYALHRLTISLVSPQMSHGKWDENEIRQTMAAFHARYLITYPGASDESAPEQRESAFLHNLAQGEHPSWLALAARTPHVAIFEDTDEGQEASRLSSQNGELPK